MAFNQYAKTERDFSSILNSANMSAADRDKLSAILASLVGSQSTVPGIEQQITSIETEIGEIVAAISNIKVPVWKMQVFDADGTFTVPESIAGSVVYVTGSGGGGSGGASVITSTGNSFTTGASSGCYIERQPYTVSVGDSIPVTIGSGGAAVTFTSSTAGSTPGNDGGESSFGSLVIGGGSGGTKNTYYGAWRGGTVDSAGVVVLAQSSLRYSAGAWYKFGNVTVSGSGAGAFGPGVDGNGAVDTNVTGYSADANSGAGGGHAAIRTTGGSYTATSGAGGSGKIIVEWQEFV